MTAAASCWTTMPAWISTSSGTAPRPPRRRQSPAPAHHGQDPAEEPPHRHALHQTRRRSGRGHRHPRPIPQALRAFPACTLYISAGQRLLRWIYGQCYEDPCIGEDLPRGAAPRSLCARPPRSQGGAGRRAAGSAALAAPPSRQERGRPGSRPAPRQRCGPRRKPGHSPRECPGRRRSVRRHPGWAGASGSRPAGRHRRV
jgi:hypothetical protein